MLQGEDAGRRLTSDCPQAVATWGTDFETIARLFPKRDRRQIKNKWNREERANPNLLEDAVRARRFKSAVEYEQDIKAMEGNTEFKDVDLTGEPPEIERKPYPELEDEEEVRSKHGSDWEHSVSRFATTRGLRDTADTLSHRCRTPKAAALESGEAATSVATTSGVGNAATQLAVGANDCVATPTMSIRGQRSQRPTRGRRTSPRRKRSAPLTITPIATAWTMTITTEITITVTLSPPLLCLHLDPLDPCPYLLCACGGSRGIVMPSPSCSRRASS